MAAIKYSPTCQKAATQRRPLSLSLSCSLPPLLLPNPINPAACAMQDSLQKNGPVYNEPRTKETHTYTQSSVYAQAERHAWVCSKRDGMRRSTQEAKEAVDVICMTSEHPHTHAGVFHGMSNWPRFAGLLFYSFVVLMSPCCVYHVWCLHCISLFVRLYVCEWIRVMLARRTTWPFEGAATRSDGISPWFVYLSPRLFISPPTSSMLERGGVELHFNLTPSQSTFIRRLILSVSLWSTVPPRSLSLSHSLNLPFPVLPYQK